MTEKRPKRPYRKRQVFRFTSSEKGGGDGKIENSKAKGYVRFYRSFWSWRWAGDPPARDVYIYCFSMAARQPVTVDGVHLEKGELLISQRKLAETLGFSRQQIRTALQNLESTQEVTQQSTQGSTQQWTKITVIKWAKYQHSGNYPTQPSTQPSTQPLEIPSLYNNNKKNNKKNNKIYSGAGSTPDPVLLEQSKEIIGDLNRRSGKKFKPDNRETLKLIKKRLAEGYAAEDFRAVIKTKVKEWKNDERMSKYLRPSTLFGENFESYLQETINDDDDDVYSEWKDFKYLGPDGTYVTWNGVDDDDE